MIFILGFLSGILTAYTALGLTMFLKMDERTKQVVKRATDAYSPKGTVVSTDSELQKAMEFFPNGGEKLSIPVMEQGDIIYGAE